MDNIRPIKTEGDYDWAIAEIAKYFENEPQVDSPDGLRFEVLTALVEVYEDKHYPIEAPDPVEAIRAHMEMAGLRQVALAKIIGSASRASEIMNRKRALTMDQAYLLFRNWHIPAEVLIQPYHLAADDNRKHRGARMSA